MFARIEAHEASDRLEKSYTYCMIIAVTCGPNDCDKCWDKQSRQLSASFTQQHVGRDLLRLQKEHFIFLILLFCNLLQTQHFAGVGLSLSKYFIAERGGKSSQVKLSLDIYLRRCHAHFLCMIPRPTGDRSLYIYIYIHVLL